MKLYPKAFELVMIVVMLGVCAATPLTDARSTKVPDWQTPASGKMSFEIASVKQNKSGNPGGQENLTRPGGAVKATNVSLELLIEKAYFRYGAPNIQFMLFGTSGWMRTLRFDIEARANGEPTVEQKQLMLRSLLEDRFSLVVHHETRQLPIYAVVLTQAGKIGPQLTRHVDDTNCLRPAAPAPPTSRSAGEFTPFCGAFYFLGPRNGGLFLEARAITMEGFEANLSGLVERLVVDHTGLRGTFDLTLLYAPDVGETGSQIRAQAPFDTSSPPTIFPALQQQLGLKLDPQTGSVDVLVVDHAEQPSEN